MQPYGDLHAFVVDPQRDGVANGLWKNVVGTPSVTGNKFRFNTAEGLVRADVLQGRFEFSVNFPTTGVQTVTDLAADIEFGLKNLSLANASKISVLADQSEDEFSFITRDRFGTAQTTVIVWQTDWNSAKTVFIIEWFVDRVRLSVLNDTETTPVVLADHKTRVGEHPLNPFMKATGNDNFDVDYIVVEKAKMSSIMII